MNTKKPMSLTSRVILGMVAGILTGFAIRSLFADNGFVDTYIVNGLFEVGGQIFVASLKMLVVPLVFVSLVCGTSSLKDLSTLGRMGGKTLAFYITTTAVAITLALTMGNLFQPGAGADLTAASLLCGTCWPRSLSFTIPEDARIIFEEWSAPWIDHPGSDWVRHICDTYRSA